MGPFPKVASPAAARCSTICWGSRAPQAWSLRLPGAGVDKTRLRTWFAAPALPGEPCSWPVSESQTHHCDSPNNVDPALEKSEVHSWGPGARHARNGQIPLNK